MSTALGTDFVDAHQRHWHDAELLWQHQRWANADQLYGLAAECGLKALMLKFGMQWDHNHDAPQKKQDKIHANKAWDRYEAYRSGHSKGAAYALPANNPFDDWGVNQRYARTAAITETRTRAHRAGAELVKNLTDKVERDGLLT